MQTHKYIWKSFQRNNVVSFVVKSGVAAAMTLLFGGATLGVNLGGMHSPSTTSCRDDDRSYTIMNGNTSNGFAGYARSRRWVAPVQHAIALPNAFSSSQGSCAVSGQAGSGMTYVAVMRQAAASAGREARMRTVVLRRAAKAIRSHARGVTVRAYATLGAKVATGRAAPAAAAVQLKRAAVSLPETGPGNTFPYGVCTWYADERYHQLHGVYVPWHANANAWQWTARAYEYGWHVSSYPSAGSIIVLQSGVQGASWLGHVGIVERVLGDGQVIASSMNWGGYPGAVTYWHFSSGPGVTFINQ